MTENLPRGSFARGGEGVPGILIFRIIIIIIIFLFLYPHYANLNRILCALRQSTANEAAVQLQRRPAQERARNGIQNPVNGAPTLFRIIIIIIIFSFSLSTLCQLEFDQQPSCSNAGSPSCQLWVYWTRWEEEVSVAHFAEAKIEPWPSTPASIASSSHAHTRGWSGCFMMSIAF